jgi:hypothetical protein
VPLLPAIFAGAAMTATSIGITASVLGELKFLRSRDGQTVIGAAVLDDILGIVILAVVVALAGGEGFALAPVLKLVAAAAVFVAVALLLSRTAAPAFDWLLDRLRAPGEVVVAAFLVLSLACFAAQAFGLEAALGAFAGGLILSSSRHRHAIEEAVKPLVALFATVFFVLIGSGLDLAVLNPFDAANHEGLVMAGFLLVAAVISKTASPANRATDISVTIRPLSSAKYPRPSRPMAGTLPVIWRASQAAVPGPAMRNRENPGRSRMPAASRTARHSSRTAPNHGPSRRQVRVPSSDVSSPGRAYHSARSQPLYGPYTAPSARVRSCTADSLRSRAAGQVWCAKWMAYSWP